MKNVKKLGFLALLFIGLNAANAQNISFGTISKSEEKAFKKYWKLSDEDMEKYQSYMHIAGKYRHQQSNPLVVLSIISDDPEDKAYHAAKAAKYESEMSKREITTAWLLSNEMEKQGLTEAMEEFASELTGTDTKDYIPESIKSKWESGDAFVLVVDDICRQTNCLKQFKKTMNAIPATVTKTVLFKNLKQAYEADSLKQIVKAVPGAQFKRFDSVEHGYLSGLKNQAAHVRDNKLIRKL